VTLLYVII